MTLKAAFEAWVDADYGPDGPVCWALLVGHPTPPYIYQDGDVVELDDVWTAYQAAHAAAIEEAAAGVVSLRVEWMKPAVDEAQQSALATVEDLLEQIRTLAEKEVSDG